MLYTLKKKDFAVLRESLESGRQSPDSVSGALFLLIFMQPLLYYLIYYVAAETTTFPNVEKIQEIHLWVTSCLVFFCGLYTIPAIYKASQSIQYFIMILSIRNLGAVYFYLGALFLVGDNNAISLESLMIFTKVTFTTGVLLFLGTYIRFYILLKKSHYRTNSKKGRLRKGFETKSYIPLAIVGSTGLVFVIQYVFRRINSIDISDMFLIILSMGIFYTMIFVLPEQLVILYCKFRFKSFNFDKNGVLNKR